MQMIFRGVQVAVERGDLKYSESQAGIDDEIT